MQPFHLAFPVTSLATARSFYGDLLGCPEGRSSDEWVDFNFYIDLPRETWKCNDFSLAVHGVVVFCSKLVTGMYSVKSCNVFVDLAEKLKKAGVKFVIEPHIRFKGQVGEQATMFFLDPCGNAVEFKAFANPASLFAK